MRSQKMKRVSSLHSSLKEKIANGGGVDEDADDYNGDDDDDDKNERKRMLLTLTKIIQQKWKAKGEETEE